MPSSAFAVLGGTTGTTALWKGRGGGNPCHVAAICGVGWGVSQHGLSQLSRFDSRKVSCILRKELDWGESSPNQELKRGC